MRSSDVVALIYKLSWFYHRTEFIRLVISFLAVCLESEDLLFEASKLPLNHFAFTE